MNQVLLVGCGNMGQALLKAWVKTDGIDKIYVIQPSLSAKTLFEHNPKVAFYSDAKMLPAELKPSVCVLAFKPQQLTKALEPFGLIEMPMVSLLAGVSINTLSQYAGKNTPCIRIMPNLGVQIGQGASLAFASQKYEIIEKLFANTGKLFWVSSEKLLDLLTLISGCGPAYFYLMADIMTQMAIDFGLEKEQALLLVKQTLLGSALMTDSQISFEYLMSRVASKGGVTEVALSVLKPDLEQSFQKAIEATLVRLKELSR